MRHIVHSSYVKIDPVSPHSPHTLNNKHSYGHIEQTMELSKYYNKEVKRNIWKLFLYTFSKHKIYYSKNRKSITPTHIIVWHKALHYITKLPIPIPVYSAPHTHTPNHGKSIKLIYIINHFHYNVIFYYILYY